MTKVYFLVCHHFMLIKSAYKLTQYLKLNLDKINRLFIKIRYFECLIHIAYSFDFKKWRVSKELKSNFSDRKIFFKLNLEKNLEFYLISSKPVDREQQTTGILPDAHLKVR